MICGGLGTLAGGDSPRSRATMRTMNQALRAYRPKSRLGSSPSRKAHSRPDFCIQRGARRIRPAANSREAPTWTLTGTPISQSVDRSTAHPLVDQTRRTGCRDEPNGCGRSVLPAHQRSAHERGGTRCQRPEARGNAHRVVEPLPRRRLRPLQGKIGDIPSWLPRRQYEDQVRARHPLWQG